MKRFRPYYIGVTLVTLAVILGVALFFPLIMFTLKDNPHPQINYLIFIVLAIGFYLVWVHLFRIRREANLIEDFFTVYKKQNFSNNSKAELSTFLLQFVKSKGRMDATSVLEAFVETSDAVDKGVQQAAIEAEISRFNMQQHRQLLMPGHIGGLLVGIGLCGTFVGLLGALAEVAALIGAFNFGDGKDTLAVIGGLTSRLVSPMKAMGVAFSASLFGVGGSLLMGIMMVSLRGASSHLTSTLHAKVTRAVELKEDQAPAAGKESSTVVAEVKIDDSAFQASLSGMVANLKAVSDRSDEKAQMLQTAIGNVVAKLDQSIPAMQSMASSQATQSKQLTEFLSKASAGGGSGASLEQQQALESFGISMRQLADSMNADRTANLQLMHQLNVQMSKSAALQEKLVQSVDALTNEMVQRMPTSSTLGRF
jgi:hypothetical protein